MIAADVLDVLEDAALFLGLVAGICTALVVIAKSPIVGGPLRWAARRLVVIPVEQWFRQMVTAVIDDRIDNRLEQPNGGNSLWDIASSLDEVRTHLGMDPKHPNTHRDKETIR